MIAWLGRRDSNPRMPGPKPGALPLGDGPSLRGASVLYHACESGSIVRSLSGLRFYIECRDSAIDRFLVGCGVADKNNNKLPRPLSRSLYNRGHANIVVVNITLDPQYME